MDIATVANNFDRVTRFDDDAEDPEDAAVSELADDQRWALLLRTRLF